MEERGGMMTCVGMITGEGWGMGLWDGNGDGHPSHGKYKGRVHLQRICDRHQNEEKDSLPDDTGGIQRREQEEGC